MGSKPRVGFLVKPDLPRRPDNQRQARQAMQSHHRQARQSMSSPTIHVRLHKPCEASPSWTKPKKGTNQSNISANTHSSICSHTQTWPPQQPPTVVPVGMPIKTHGSGSRLRICPWPSLLARWSVRHGPYVCAFYVLPSSTSRPVTSRSRVPRLTLV